MTEIMSFAKDSNFGDIDTSRIIETDLTNANSGHVVWQPIKSMWYLSHMLIALIGGCLTFSWHAVFVFVVFTGTTLCLGHSLGMHRRLIHGSYQCPLWLEYLFVHLGVLVSMAGPLGMMYQHDLRDWAQRQPSCHAYLRHGHSFWRDGWQQLNCDLVLDHPPKFSAESRIDNNKIYALMEKTWMWQQLPWALLLFYFGGVAWLVWGISMRIVVSLTGHWLVGHFAHNKGEQEWYIKGAAVQGYNVKFAGFFSMGESWHNNHHAYPSSALLGIHKGQSDLGFWVLKILESLGLVWNIKLPEDLAYRAELIPISAKQKDCSIHVNPQLMASDEVL